MKVYLSNLNESWVVDRIRKEWYEYNSKTTTNFISRSNIIWIIAPWIWKKISKSQLNKKKVLCTIHHINEDKFDNNQYQEFLERDSYVDIYHTPSTYSANTLRKYTNKKIEVLPFWVNQNNWFEINDKEAIRSKYGFNKEDYLVGSFQRDTEGFDLKSPKLEKGPDIFLEIIEKLFMKNPNLIVVLSGKRRQYVINNLEQKRIPYKYFEMVSIKSLNELYNILNLYIVSSRTEGGPQAIVECGRIKTPIISTNVGYAPMFMDKNSIFENSNFETASPNANHLHQSTNQLILPNGIDQFNKMLKKIYED